MQNKKKINGTPFPLSIHYYVIMNDVGNGDILNVEMDKYCFKIQTKGTLPFSILPLMA
jgi:hypothetical protein